MFTIFLIGTLLASVAALVTLLALPTPHGQERVPAATVAFLVFVAVMAFVGGLAVGA